MARMLYRHSEEEKTRKQKIHGLNVDRITVEDEEEIIEEKAKEGWCKSPTLAKELYESCNIEEPGEFDKDGFPWDARINLKDKSKSKKGLWKTKPGTKQEFLDTVRSEIGFTTEKVYDDFSEPE